LTAIRQNSPVSTSPRRGRPSMRERMPLAGVICAVALTALIVISGFEVTRARADGAVMSVDPPSQNVATDAQSFGVNVKISGANNVGGVEFGLRYDGNLVDVVDVVEGPFM